MRTISAGSHFEDSDPDEITWNPKASMEAHKSSPHKIDLTEVFKAEQLFSQTDIVDNSALTYCDLLSTAYDAKIYLKR